MKKAFKNSTYIVFAFYIAIMIWFMFFRVRSSLPLLEYIRGHSNFIPFASIIHFTESLIHGNINPFTFIYNVFGNIFAFVPLGFFIPAVFKKTRKYYKTVIAVAIIILLAESMQIFLKVGQFDIDDLILNEIGASMGYALTKIKPIRKAINECL